MKTMKTNSSIPVIEDNPGGQVLLKEDLLLKASEEKNKKQLEATDAVISAQEKERYFLGIELHDINQILVTSKLYLEYATAEKIIRKDLVDNGRQLLVKAMEEIRNLSQALLPPSLEQVGLIDAFSDMIGKIEKANSLRFITQWDNIDESKFGDKLKLTIFRIVQEQVNNIFKHAQATTAQITLLQNAGKLELTVSDNGIGFNTEDKREGAGLQNIEIRADLFNGRVSICSKPGTGCTLHVVFIL
jgi:signal transduction histidine kinase